MSLNYLVNYRLFYSSLQTGLHANVYSCAPPGRRDSPPAFEPGTYAGWSCSPVRRSGCQRAFSGSLSGDPFLDVDGFERISTGCLKAFQMRRRDRPLYAHELEDVRED